MKGSTFMKWAMLLICLFTNVLTDGAVLAESTSTEASTQDLTSLVSSNNLTSDTLSSSNLGQVSSSSSSSESTSSTSSSSTTSSESTVSTSSSEDSNSSSDSGEEVSEDDSDISTRASTQADAQASVVDIYTFDSLKTTLEGRNPPTNVRLMFDLNFKTGQKIYIVANKTKTVEIDGNGHTITYDMGPLKNNTDKDNEKLDNQDKAAAGETGFGFGADGLKITFKNVTFGNKDAYYSASGDTKANNFYGIINPGRTVGSNGTSLTVENVKYYSKKGAQPFHVYGGDTKLIFSGTNEFYMKGSDRQTQEFIEGGNIVFDDNSVTKIVDEKTGTYQTGLIWALFDPLNLVVGKNATVDITTTHDIFNVYPPAVEDPSDDEADYTVPTISIKEGGSLKITQSKAAYKGAGKIMNSYPHTKGYPDGGLYDLNISLNKSANIEINTLIPSSFPTGEYAGEHGLTVTQAKDSKATFSTASGTFLDSKSPSIFTITDAALLSFESLDKNVNGKTGPLGGSTSKINFNQGTYDYDALTNASKTDRNLKYLLTQQNGSNTWTINSSGFSRKPSFTSNEASTLNASSRLVIVKGMITALSWDQDKSTSSKIETINSSSTGAGYDGKFYWTDIYPENDIKFELSMGGTSVSIPKVLNATGTQDTYELGFTIPKEYLPTKSSEPKNYTIKAYKNRGKGYVEQSSINLTINLKEDNTLELVTVPESFNWTNRLTSQSKGILSRDADNSMSFKVIASDSIKWKLTGYSQLKSGGTKRPYSFVWKDNDNSDKLLDFAGGVDVLTNENANKNGNVYEKTWANNQGVLLKSDNYLNIGDYTDYIIEWNLTRVPTF
ncbi:hypothetical protein OZX60_05585 [Streptococcaceae bacterium ESL0687]|nr:hypothetical protein OZX60_05585 [Streptococcaceae bacterium ESL0687]